MNMPFSSVEITKRMDDPFLVDIIIHGVSVLIAEEIIKKIKGEDLSGEEFKEMTKERIKECNPYCVKIDKRLEDKQ